MWRLWAKALGEKSGTTDKEADAIAKIRTFLVVHTLLSNTFNLIVGICIIAGIWRHW